MHRKPLLEMLDRYLSQHRDEEQVVRKVQRLVSSSPDCFERTCRPGHITGAAWVLSPDRRRCLLVHHRKLKRWLQPGGHADGESNIAEVALREVREETGLADLELIALRDNLVPLDVDVHQIPARFDSVGNFVEDAHQHHDIRFLVHAAADQELLLSDESVDVSWFTRQEVLEVTHEKSILRMLHKAGPWE